MANKKYWIECFDKSGLDHQGTFIKEFDTLEEIKEWLKNNPNFIVINTTPDVRSYLEEN